VTKSKSARYPRRRAWSAFGGLALFVGPTLAADVPELPLLGLWGGAVDAVFVDPAQPDIAYIGSGRRLVILDVADPAQIRELGALDLKSHVNDVQVRDGYAYVACEYGPNAFCTVDVSDLRQPQLVWRFQLMQDWNANEVDLYGQIAYVRNGTDLATFNVADPRHAQPLDIVVQSFTGECEIVGDLLYMITNEPRVRIYDLTKPLLPYFLDDARLHLVGKVALPGNDNEWWGFDVEGRYAYAGTKCCCCKNTGAFAVVDISNPRAPVVVGTNRDFYMIRDLAVAGAFAYVADYTWAPYPDPWANAKGLVVLDVGTDPTHPTPVGRYKPHGDVRGVEVFGSRAYLMDDGEGLIILDVSQPAHPVRLGNYHSPAQVRKMDKVGDRLYVTDQWNGFAILDVSNPRRPTPVGVWQVPQNGVHMQHFGIEVCDRLAYFSAGYSGLQIVDVHEPARPKLAGAFPFPPGFSAVAMKVNGPIAHVGVQPIGGGGIFVNFDVSDPNNIVDIGFVHVGPPATIELAPNGIVHLAEGSYRSGFLVGAVDTLDPYHPFVIRESMPRACDVAYRDGRLYIAVDTTAGGLHVWDVRDPAKPVDLGRFDVWGGLGVALDRGLAYLTAQPPDGYTVFALAVVDPQSPRLAARARIPYATYILADGGHAYVTADQEGLAILSLFPRGDLNCDGQVDRADVDPFVLALTDPARYHSTFPDCDINNADVNGDGRVDNFDIDAFVKLLRNR